MEITPKTSVELTRWCPINHRWSEVYSHATMKRSGRKALERRFQWIKVELQQQIGEYQFQWRLGMRN